MQTNRWGTGCPINIATCVQQMGNVCVSHLVEQISKLYLIWTKTPCTPSIGSHPSMLGPCYWHNFIVIMLCLTYFCSNIVIYCSSLQLSMELLVKSDECVCVRKVICYFGYHCYMHTQKKHLKVDKHFLIPFLVTDIPFIA